VNSFLVENWYWFLIGYYVFCFIYLVVVAKTREKVKFFDQGFFTGIITSIIVMLLTLYLMIILPFVWIIWFTNSVNRIKSHEFTIHELTKDNKIALRQIGFEEGKFVSWNNFDYEGFRIYVNGLVGYTTISISNNGRVSIKGTLNKEVKVLIKKIKSLPYENKDEEVKSSE
jgi:hypothetical protein